MGARDQSTSAAGYGVAVTASDATTFDPPTRGLYVGGAGDVAVRMFLGQANVTFVGVPAGTLLPICVDRVLSTGTTATSVVRLY
jgi:hypothetical protein